MSRWCEAGVLPRTWRSALQVMGVCVAAWGAEPTPFAPWYAVDFADGYTVGTTVGAWQDSAGNWTAPAEGACTFARVGDEPQVELEAVTNGWLSFTPSGAVPPAAGSIHTAKAAMRAFFSWEELPDLSREGARGGILAAQRADNKLVYFGWTRDGWVELAGAEPDEDALCDLRVVFDDSTTPAKVSYSADGTPLVAATNALVSAFPTGTASAEPVPALSMRGTGRLGAFACERDLPERTAAVTAPNGGCAYYATVTGALAAATTGGGTVTLLRPAMVDGVAGDAELVIPARLLDGAKPPLTIDAGFPMDAELRVKLSAGDWSAVPFAAPAAALARLHVHGAAGMVYALAPDTEADVVRLSTASVPVDDGNFTGWICVSEGGRSFVGNLVDAGLGSNRTLFVQGQGLLTLCGTNEISGGVEVESGDVRFCTSASAPRGGVVREAPYRRPDGTLFRITRNR